MGRFASSPGDSQISFHIARAIWNLSRSERYFSRAIDCAKCNGAGSHGLACSCEACLENYYFIRAYNPSTKAYCFGGSRYYRIVRSVAHRGRWIVQEHSSEQLLWQDIGLFDTRTEAHQKLMEVA